VREVNYRLLDKFKFREAYLHKQKFLESQWLSEDKLTRWVSLGLGMTVKPRHVRLLKFFS
jgi:hypothetical protein